MIKKGRLEEGFPHRVFKQQGRNCLGKKKRRRETPERKNIFRAKKNKVRG